MSPKNRLAVSQMTKEQAVALAESGWWKEADALTIARFQLSQTLLCVDFSAFHEAVETCLGRGVWTHEFADPDRLWDELHGHRVLPTLEEIIAMLPAEKVIILNAGSTEQNL